MEPITALAANKNLELDKICRVCLAAKKDMRPLFGEMVVDMLMECARVQILNTDGWPDKICIQCIHQVSRCHAFKLRVERSDQELRNYIKGLTVIVQEPITQISVPSNHQQQQSHTQIHQNRAELLKSDQIPQTRHTHVQATEVPSQVVISNGQLHNAQILNAAQIVTTHGGQNVAQIMNANQIGQLLQSGNTVQMIQQNGQPAQVVQFHRTADDRCEIIVQPDIQPGEAQYFEDVTVTQAIQADQIEHTEDVIHIQEEEEIEEEEDETMSEELTFTLEISDESDTEDKLYLAEFISLQTSCPQPGRYVCNLCRKEFKHSRWLQTHMKSHSNWIKANCKRQPQCDICHRSFKGPGMLKMHMKTHEKSAVKIPTCNICNKEFKSKTILYRHRQTHQMKAYQCGNCFRAFTSPYTLVSHMTKKHSTDDLKFRCVKCEEEFSAVEELKVHVHTLGHTGLEPKKEDGSS